MSELTLETRCQVPADVIFRELEGEAVLLNLETGVYFGLDSVGTRIWQLLVELHRLGDVHRKMMEEFEVSRDVLERDLLNFAGRLREKGLVAIED